MPVRSPTSNESAAAKMGNEPPSGQVIPLVDASAPASYGPPSLPPASGEPVSSEEVASRRPPSDAPLPASLPDAAPEELPQPGVSTTTVESVNAAATEGRKRVAPSRLRPIARTVYRALVGGFLILP